MIVRFVDIDGTVDNYRLKFLFIMDFVVVLLINSKQFTTKNGTYSSASVIQIFRSG